MSEASTMKDIESAPYSASPRVTVVLPAFNEADNIPPLCRALTSVREQGMDVGVILVDDGSSDETGEIALRSIGRTPLLLLRNDINRGLGETFARGMLAAMERATEDEVIVCMDADDSHPPAQIPALVAAIEAGADVAVASRYRAGARIVGVPLHRRLLAQGLSYLFRAVHPVPGVRDYSTGFRAYRASILKAALREHGDELFDRTGFGCMVALIVRLSESGARCVEVPVDLRYDRKKGDSKMRIGPTLVHTLRVLAAARAGRQRGR